MELGHDSLSCSDSSSVFTRPSRSLSVSSAASAKILALRVVEFFEYYPKRRFHPVHLMDTFGGDRYKVIRKLGFGSFSTVWLARDTLLDRYVALKIGQAETDSSSAEEKEIYDRLAKSEPGSHPGRDQYLPLLDDFQFQGPNGTHQALVYEPMGASVTEVKDVLFADGPFPLWTAKSILWQTVLGLDFMLSHDIVHGDIQPRNILFTLEGLADQPFEAMIQDKNIPLCPTPEVDLPGGVTGPRYLVPADSLMPYLDITKPFGIRISDLGGSFLNSNPPKHPSPPLHLRGPETLFEGNVSAAQDMWSFGCLIFEFLTGTSLFDLMDYSVTSITDDMHFIDMYNVLGFPEDKVLRDRHWPNWRQFFTDSGKKINHYTRKRERDWDVYGEPTAFTLEGLLEEALGGNLNEEELKCTVHLLRGLLEFDPAKRLCTKDVLGHKWFEEFKAGVCL
ncbi:kinase-like domain-containing protein [Aspergillus venezuelensis]